MKSPMDVAANTQRGTLKFIRASMLAQARHAPIAAVALSFLLAASALAAQQRRVAPAFEQPDRIGARWFKGNTHAHTLESDGDAPPIEVATWYKRHGYAFLVLSDHNVFTDPRTLSSLIDSTFLLIPGEELTTSFRRKPVHVNGLNIPGLITPRTDTTLVGTIQKNVDAVREVDGVPHINHPNFGWAFDDEVLAQVKRDRLLEIFNGHPLVHNDGGGEHRSLEEIWDRLLTRGKRIYGIAVDDAHHFREEFAAHRSNPGRGWVVVRADSLTASSLLTSLENGQFYATTGVELDDVSVANGRMRIQIRQRGDFAYRTEFIGSGGRVLARSKSNPADYRLRGGERYVRARVMDSGGNVAWVQPAFVSGARVVNPAPTR